MKKRIADKIIKAVLEYKQLDRWDMPYNGKQIYQAAKTILPPCLRNDYKGWHKETAEQGYLTFINQLNGQKL